LLTIRVEIHVFLFLYSLTCNFYPDIDTAISVTFAVRIYYPTNYLCQTLYCVLQFLDRMFAEFQQLLEVILNSDNGIPVRLQLCIIVIIDRKYKQEKFQFLSL